MHERSDDDDSQGMGYLGHSVAQRWVTVYMPLGDFCVCVVVSVLLDGHHLGQTRTTNCYRATAIRSG
jgi:hypothetical protein